MDITRSNFKSNIAEIKSAIANSTFVTIDCEFSGLHIDSDVNINPYDSFEQYYNKLKRSVTKFLVLQFGICTFRYDKNDKKFKQKCFNFYLFPRSTHKSIPDQRFSCQASSIEFLCKHDFDFNKVFKEGIPYLNQEIELKYRQVIDEKHKEKLNNISNTNEQGIIPVPNEDKSFVKDIMEIIKKFLASAGQELMLPHCNAFRRRLIYQTAREKYGNLCSLETRTLETKDRVLFVLKPETPAEKAQKEQEKYNESMTELEDAVGFSRIIQFLSESRKLIVGHNLYTDFLHMVDKFLTPIPDYEDFKECANCLFPRILDTKYMASSGPFKDLINNTVLGYLVNAMKNKPFETPEIQIEENAKGYSLVDEKEHESGFDAFLTGYCFLSMLKYLYKSPDLYKIIEDENSKVLKPYVNRIFMQRLQDCLYMNLNGNDSKLNRDHVFHLTFPKEWKLNDINQLFSPFGNIHVAWINESSAYVALYKKEHANQALSTLSKSNTCKIISYARHQENMKAQKRESEPMVHLQSKKRRKDPCFGESSRNFNTLSEDESESIANRMTKMFDENSAWD